MTRLFSRPNARRWLQGLSAGSLIVAAVAMNTGCGAMGAMANPKTAWALGESAPMTVVVRRADAATVTGKEVDRLLTSTPANPDSDWIAKVGPAKEDIDANTKNLGQHPAYTAPKKSRIVASEIWSKTLPGVTSSAGQYPNLLAAIDAGLADKYAAVMSKKKEVGDLRAQKDAEKDKAKADALDKQADAAEDAVKPLQKDFVAAAKTAAGKASADVQSKFGPAFVNLHQAVEDAKIANSAAAAGYPMAVPGIKDSATRHLSTIVGDIIEEKTGKRPNMASLQPNLTLDGTNVTVTLNGLSKDDMGKLSMSDLVSETTAREQKWVGHALGLLGTISTNKEVLGFEDDTLEAVLDGFKSGGYAAPAAAPVPDGSGAAPGASGGGGGLGGFGMPSAPSAPAAPGAAGKTKLGL